MELEVPLVGEPIRTLDDLMEVRDGTHEAQNQLSSRAAQTARDLAVVVTRTNNRVREARSQRVEHAGS